jgi:transmembrane sensor
MDQLDQLERIAKLISLHLTGDIGQEDQVALDQWIHSSERNKDIFNRITDAESLAAALRELQNTDTEGGLFLVKQRIAEEDQKPKRRVVGLWFQIAAAASIVFILSIGGYFLLHKPGVQQYSVNAKNDIAPGGNKAILVLANGKQIILTAAKNGLLSQQGSVAVNKTADGQLVYNNANPKSEIKHPNSEITYNTMITPRGGTYSVTLSDGTKVWLNDVSSIKYPTAFTGKERDVEITGEAYFEVAHNPNKPFRVTVAGQTVEVLGTHFNINAYPEEGPIRTTLLEGKVKVTRNGQTATLLPGQQAQAGISSINVFDHADTEQATAWKDGFFRIDNSDLPTIMRQVERWYDVTVVYQGKIPSVHFSGEMRRNVEASKLLHMLSFFDIHYQIQGRTIIVSPQ